MKLLKEIMYQWGFVTSEQVAELAQYFPQTELIIQWGRMPREPMHADLVAQRIKEVEDSDEDYVRQVFIQSQSMRKLREVFGEPV
tara:strand:- start:12041 stop:12295 length:255 start_codon:yes stop_codon:yes gene_type:complete